MSLTRSESLLESPPLFGSYAGGPICRLKDVIAGGARLNRDFHRSLQLQEYYWDFLFLFFSLFLLMILSCLVCLLVSLAFVHLAEMFLVALRAGVTLSLHVVYVALSEPCLRCVDIRHSASYDVLTKHAVH